MTREEAIKILKRDNPNNITIRDGYEKLFDDRKEAFGMAIKALEQEPTDDATLKDIFCMGCEYKEQEPCDAISIEEALKAVDKRVEQLSRDKEFIKKRGDIDVYGVKQYLLALPSVYPKQKIGHWIKIEPYPLQEYDYECSECLKETNDNTWKYCPECGAKMVESQAESEE